MVVCKMRLRVKYALLHKLGFVQPAYFYTPWLEINNSTWSSQLGLARHVERVESWRAKWNLGLCVYQQNWIYTMKCHYQNWKAKAASSTLSTDWTAHTHIPWLRRRQHSFWSQQQWHRLHQRRAETDQTQREDRVGLQRDEQLGCRLQSLSSLEQTEDCPANNTHTHAHTQTHTQSASKRRSTKASWSSRMHWTANDRTSQENTALAIDNTAHGLSVSFVLHRIG